MNRLHAIVLSGAASGVLLIGAGGTVAMARPAEQQGTNTGSRSRDALAANLGITRAQLDEAITRTKAQRPAIGTTRNAAATRRDPAAQRPGADRQRIIAGLAQLAGVTPQQFLQAVQEYGGVQEAAAALGVTEDQILGLLAEIARVSLQAAVDEGRLTSAQADQIAATNARRLFRVLNRYGAPRP